MSPRDALETAYREHGLRVLGYLQARISNRHDCEELLQETFAIAAEDMSSLIGARSQVAWLIGIARNLILEYGRRRKTSDSAALILVEAPEDESGDINAVRAAIRSLPAAQREVLEMRLQSELSYAEIAETLAVPIGTVRSRIHHALRQLKQSLERTGAVMEK